MESREYLTLPQSYRWITPIAFTRDGAGLIGDSDLGPVVWTIADSKVNRLPSLTRGWTLTGNGTRVISGGSLWDLPQLQANPAAPPSATLTMFGKDLCLITTAHGYFECSPELTKMICWQQGTQVYSYQQFEKQYYRPELVEKALQGEARVFRGLTSKLQQ